MLLPFAEKAFIDDRKLTDYCLSETHITGKYKARVFKSALSITVSDSEILKNDILTAALLHDASYSGQNNQGDLYAMDFVMSYGSKSANVRTARKTPTRLITPLVDNIAIE